MTTTHKNRALARRAGDCAEERAGFSDPTAPVPTTAFGNLDRGQGARSPRTNPAGGRVTPPLNCMAQFRLNLAALLVGAVLLGVAA